MNEPEIVSNNPVVINTKKVSEIDCPNPNCRNTLRIDQLDFGVSVACPHCKNITYNPFEVKKHWWFKMRNFIISIILTLIIGIVAGIAANAIWFNISIFK